jgi:hypothetical protein
MGKSRVWIFRVLVLAVAALLIYSWFMPWWQASVDQVGIDAVVIHPWGLEKNMPEELLPYVMGSDMPVWFAPVMWSYLGIVVLALLSSLFVANKKVKLWKIKATLPGMMIGIVGISYVVVVALAVIVASIRTNDFYYMKFLGRTLIDLGGEITTNATGTLLLGYWLAVASGPLLIALAFLRKKITGSTD